MKLTPQQVLTLRALLTHASEDFVELSMIAGLRPEEDFRFANLRNVDFGESDLGSFDFTGADLTGADLSRVAQQPRRGEALGDPIPFDPLGPVRTAVGAAGLGPEATDILEQLVNAGGVLEAGRVARQLELASQDDLAGLKNLGVELGRFSIFIPAALPATAMPLTVMYGAATYRWEPSTLLPTQLRYPLPPTRELATRGLIVVGRWAVPVFSLEILGDHIRSSASYWDLTISEADLDRLGWTSLQLAEIVSSLGFRAKKSRNAEVLWWRKNHRTPVSSRGGRGQVELGWAILRAVPPPPAEPSSPFDVLRNLKFNKKDD